MIHCKHSRIAKSADEPPQSHREADPWRATGRLSNPRFWWRIHTVEGEVGQLENHATRDGVCPARHSSPLRLTDFFPPFLLLVVVAALQPVHPERVLCGRVCQHHVWIVEHVQPVQGQRVDLQLV